METTLHSGTEQTFAILSLAQLDPPKFNARKEFEEEALAELAASIKENGIIEPLIVRRTGPEQQNAYQIVAGERRFRAAEMAHVTKIPCLIRDLDDAQAEEVALLENLHREDLEWAEEAAGYKRLVELGRHTVESLAQRLGKSKRHVYDCIRSCDVVPEVLELVGQGKLPGSVTSALVAFNEEDQLVVAQAAIEAGKEGKATAATLRKAVKERQRQRDQESADRRAKWEEEDQKRQAAFQLRDKERKAQERSPVFKARAAAQDAYQDIELWNVGAGTPAQWRQVAALCGKVTKLVKAMKPWPKTEASGEEEDV